MPKAKRPSSKGSEPTAMPPTGGMERTMAEVRRLLESQPFSSIEEANAFLQQALASGQFEQTAPPETPLEQAQELMYEAFDTPSAPRRLQLARQALKISPDCADAYVLLAEEVAQTPWESIRYYQDGMAAGERALGAEEFAECIGHFWGLIETRPYMRARLGLAQLLAALGRRLEAIEHYRALLHLNPGDNQGVRYLLCSALLELGADDEVQKLLDEYDEESAAWLYNRALLLYRRAGNSDEAVAALRAALPANPHVPDYLLQEKPMPDRMPDYVGFGDESEAMAYNFENGLVWVRTLGALNWLQSMRRSAPRRGTARRARK